MSSNITAKNKIYSFKKYDSLPYESSQMIDYHAQRYEVVDGTRLNNTYGQCVDNDLYVVKSLAGIKNNNAYVGPILATSDSEIANLPDGAKFFNDASSSRIMQKHVDTLDQSMYRSNDPKFYDTTLVQKIGTYAALICTSSKTYAAFVDEINAADGNQFSPQNEIKDEYGKDVVVTASIKHGTYSGMLFGGMCENLSYVYMLDTSSGQKSATGYKFKILHSHGSDPIRSIAFGTARINSTNKQIVAFATDFEVYICDIYGERLSNVRCMSSLSSGESDQICALQVESDRLVVFTVGGAIYYVGYSGTRTGFLNAKMYTLSTQNILIHDVLTIGEKKFYATSHGLCYSWIKRKNSSIYIVDTTYTNPIYNLSLDSQSNIWFVDNAGQIFSYDVESNTIRSYAQVAAPVGALYIVSSSNGNDVKIVLSEGKIKYEHQSGTFEEVNSLAVGDSTASIADMSVQTLMKQHGSNVMYFSGIEGSNNIGANFMTVNVGTGTGTNYNAIQDITESFQFSKSGGYASSIFSLIQLYFISGSTLTSHRYALVNYSKSKSYYSSLYCIDNPSSPTLVKDFGNEQIVGAIRTSPAVMRIITTNYVHTFELQGPDALVTSSPVAKSSSMDGKVIICGQMIKGDENRCVATLSSMSGTTKTYKVAIVNFANNNANVEFESSNDIGISSNVCFYDGSYVALRKLASRTNISAYDVAAQLSSVEVENEVLSGIYNGVKCCLVDGGLLKVDGASVFRRTDFLVPYGTSYGTSYSISAVQSFLSVDSENNVYIRNMKVDEIRSSTGFVDTGWYRNISYSNDYNVVCYIAKKRSGHRTTDHAIYRYKSPFKSYDDTYVEQTIKDPSRLFSNGTGTGIASYDDSEEDSGIDILDAIVEDVAYEHSGDVSSIVGITTIQILSDNTVRRRQIMTADHQTTPLSLDSGFVPKFLAKSGLYTYVAASSSTQTKVYAFKHDSTTADKTLEFATASYGELKQIVFSYDYGSLPSLGADTLHVSPTATFADDASNPSYSYISMMRRENASDDPSSDLVASGKLILAFESCVATYEDNNTTLNTSSATKTLILPSMLDSSSLHQTQNAICNLLFTSNVIGIGFDAETYAVYLGRAGTPCELQYISDTHALVVNESKSALLDGITWISKDDNLGYSAGLSFFGYALFAKDNGETTSISAVHYADSTWIATCNLEKKSSNICLVKCKNKPFSGTGAEKYALYSYTQDGINYIALQKMGSRTSIEYKKQSSSGRLHILNGLTDGTNDKLYPSISYKSNVVGTIAYPKTYNVTFNGQETITAQADTVDVLGIDLDSRKNSIFYIKNNTLAGLEIYKADFDASTHALTLFRLLESASNVTYPDNFARLTSSSGGKVFGIANGNNYAAVLDTTNGNTTEINANGSIEQMVRNANIGVLAYEDDKYCIYGSVGGAQIGAFKLVYDGYGLVNDVTRSSASLTLPSNNYLQNVLPLSSNAYGVQTLHNIYEFDSSSNSNVLRYSNNSYPIGMLMLLEMGGEKTYVASIGNAILSSSSLAGFSSGFLLANIGSSTSSPKVGSMVWLNQNVTVAAKDGGTDVGLYYTKYEYSVEDITIDFTAESAYYAYYDNRERIDDTIDGALQSHLLSGHGENSDIALINSYMGTNFEVSGFMSMRSMNDIQNDYIDTVVFGTSKDENILAFAANSASNYQWKAIDCSYMAKCWKSGITELYIYLPTTYTFYVPHVAGSGEPVDDPRIVLVNGKNLQSTVHGNETSVMVDIMDSSFFMSKVLENTIKGNSLPLRIFKDEDEENLDVSLMYHSVVCPSVAKKFSTSDTYLGYYTLEYRCFGSDAQAIKLSFFDPTPKDNRLYKTIVYNANGGTNQRLPGMKKISQRIYEGQEDVAMHWEVFEKEGAFFVGWSTSQTALDGDAEYFNGRTFSYSDIKRKQLVLYACWIQYKFGPNDTQMSISNEMPQDYTIAEITIDPNASLDGNPSLGNKLVVDYGE